jgi:hypothetical protein
MLHGTVETEVERAAEFFEDALQLIISANFRGTVALGKSFWLYSMIRHATCAVHCREAVDEGSKMQHIACKSVTVQYN